MSIMANPDQTIDFTIVPHFVIDEYAQIADSFEDDLANIKFWWKNRNCQVSFNKFPINLNFPLITFLLLSQLKNMKVVITTSEWSAVLSRIAKREKITNPLVLIGYRSSLAAYEFAMNDTEPRLILSSYANRANDLIGNLF